MSIREGTLLGHYSFGTTIVSDRFDFPLSRTLFGRNTLPSSTMDLRPSFCRTQRFNPASDRQRDPILDFFLRQVKHVIFEEQIEHFLAYFIRARKISLLAVCGDDRYGANTGIFIGSKTQNRAIEPR